MDFIFIKFIHLLYELSPELLSFYEFLFYTASLLVFFRFFGLNGLITFSSVAIIIANIQIQREVAYSFQASSLAHGTILFSFIFLATDMITEHFGANAAKKSILLSFCVQFFMGIVMLLTLGYRPIAQNDPPYQALFVLFSPSMRFFIGSLISFLMSQILDIYLFTQIKKRLESIHWLWLRSLVSTLISGLTDNIIFSVLVFYILAPDPTNLHKLFFTYIIGTYWFRAFVAVMSTPIIYLSYYVKKENTR